MPPSGTGIRTRLLKRPSPRATRRLADSFRWDRPRRKGSRSRGGRGSARSRIASTRRDGVRVERNATLRGRQGTLEASRAGPEIAPRIVACNVLSPLTMTLRTRLLLPLLATVTVVMAAYAAWSVRQRSATLIAEDRREAAAFANALALALEAALVDPEWRGVQDVVDRLTRDPQISAVRVYSVDGTVAFESANLRDQPAAPLSLVARRGGARRHRVRPGVRRQPTAGVVEAPESRDRRAHRCVRDDLSAFVRRGRDRAHSDALPTQHRHAGGRSHGLLWLVRRQIGDQQNTARLLRVEELRERLRQTSALAVRHLGPGRGVGGRGGSARPDERQPERPGPRGPVRMTSSMSAALRRASGRSGPSTC